jgi:hypothetical protein
MDLIFFFFKARKQSFFYLQNCLKHTFKTKEKKLKYIFMFMSKTKQKMKKKFYKEFMNGAKKITAKL